MQGVVFASSSPLNLIHLRVNFNGLRPDRAHTSRAWSSGSGKWSGPKYRASGSGAVSRGHGKRRSVCGARIVEGRRARMERRARAQLRKIRSNLSSKRPKHAVVQPPRIYIYVDNFMTQTLNYLVPIFLESRSVLTLNALERAPIIRPIIMQSTLTMRGHTVKILIQAAVL